MKTFTYILIICGFLLASCVEFLSPDVSSAQVKLISPVDSLVTSASSITIWWEDQSDAESYEIQLVRPDFDNPSVILDSVLLGNRIEISLDEGAYASRIRIRNEVSSSPFQNFRFFVDQTAPFQPLLLGPADSAIFSQNEPIILSWESQDVPIDNIQLTVTDSIYLYEMLNQQLMLRERYYDFKREREWKLSQEIVNNIENFAWRVVSIDQAGNKNTSSLNIFTID